MGVDEFHKKKIWQQRNGVISIQVLLECYVTITGKIKNPLSPVLARSFLSRYSAWPVYRPDVQDLSCASEISERYQLSFWDFMIIVAANQSMADVLLTEDLQHGQNIEGIRIKNPFIG